MHDLIIFLIDKTPYLAGGFLVNVIISVGAMLMGTGLGTIIALPIARHWRVVRWLSGLSVNLSRNVPSFVLMFYIAFILPDEIVFGDTVIAISPEIKAAIALVLPVLGFAADQFLGLVRGSGTFQNYLASWIQYFLIILMASVTASVIGADEVLSRANKLISTRSELYILIGTYTYVAIWFVLSGFAFNWIVSRIGLRSQNNMKLTDRKQN